MSTTEFLVVLTGLFWSSGGIAGAVAPFLIIGQQTCPLNVKLHWEFTAPELCPLSPVSSHVSTPYENCFTCALENVASNANANSRWLHSQAILTIDAYHVRYDRECLWNWIFEVFSHSESCMTVSVLLSPLIYRGSLESIAVYSLMLLSENNRHQTVGIPHPSPSSFTFASATWTCLCCLDLSISPHDAECITCTV